MRLVGRSILVLVTVVILLAAFYGIGSALRWLNSPDAFGLLVRQPTQPVRLSTLDPYTRRVAGKAWFRRYFTTMVFARQAPGISTGSPVLAKWERPRVVIGQLNSDGPAVTAYLRRLVARLDRLQQRVRFVVGASGQRITIRYLSHAAYVRAAGTDSVGNTQTHYYTTSPGLISANIVIDVGVQDTLDEVESTLIHELTHAIGASGHFYAPSARSRSVMFEANTLTSWSQDDAAVIRLLYTPAIHSGMTRAQATAVLKRYARAP